MSRWLVIRDELGVIPAPFVEGASGVRALNDMLPDHMIGIIRRVRAWEHPDFVLQQLIKRAGETYASGPQCGYKYHKPTITRIT